MSRVEAAHEPDCRQLAMECLAALAVLAAYHLGLMWLMRHTGLELGALNASPRVVRIVPLYMYWAPHIKLSCLPAAAMLIVLVTRHAPRLVCGLRSTWLVLLALCACHIAVAVSVGMIDSGPRGLARPYRDLAATDYIGAVGRVGSPRTFLGQYPQISPSLPMHCRSHPPGAVLFLWLVGRVFGEGPLPAALATILAAALATPAVYLLARQVLDEQRARLAAILYLLAPSVVLFSATCMDAVFAVPLVWSIFFIWKGSTRWPIVCGMLAGLSAAVAALMTFSIAVVAVWGLVLLAADWRWRRANWSRTATTIAVAALAAVAFYAALDAWSGYDPIATFQAAVQAHDRAMAGTSHETWPRHLHFVVANLVAFFVCAGLASTVLFGRALRQALISKDWPAGPLILSLAAAVLVVDLLPLYTLEVEHIWLFLVPWVSIGAASQLAPTVSPGRLAPAAILVLALSAGQTFAMELLLHTHW